jgi:hypothetical protein
MKLNNNDELCNFYIRYIISFKSFKSNKYKLFSLILSLKLPENLNISQLYYQITIML